MLDLLKMQSKGWGAFVTSFQSYSGQKLCSYLMQQSAMPTMC